MTMTASLVFQHFSVVEMTDDEYAACNELQGNLEKILMTIHYLDRLGVMREEDARKEMKNGMQACINIMNKDKDLKYYFWLDEIDTIEINDFMDIAEYSEPKQRVIRSILQSIDKIPSDLKLELFSVCVFVRGVPMTIVKPK